MRVNSKQNNYNLYGIFQNQTCIYYYDFVKIEKLQ